MWDLDHTIWNGILLEDDTVSLREGIVEVIHELDERGILLSIASRNEAEPALNRLKELGIRDYFIYPQIHWGSKAMSVKEIASSINIGLDSIAFVDDQLFERDEVKSIHPEVWCLDPSSFPEVLSTPPMNPIFITSESRLRRQLYQTDQVRKQAEEHFLGTQEEFLATLSMQMHIASAGEEDLQRAEELTVRTHQLNTTGYTYSYEELDLFRQSPNHRLWLTGLEDKYGTYGKVGLALLECSETTWNIKLLLMSCRVMSRGVGSMLLNFIIREAKEAGVELVAEFLPTNVNRMMYVAYTFAGFEPSTQEDGMVLFKHAYTNIQKFPEYVKLSVDIGKEQGDIGENCTTIFGTGHAVPGNV
ncbi:hypothetical protein D3C77_318760 [compost metagenome]